MPEALIRILNRDLAAAGIEKKDGQDRTVDVHALRHSFGTLLSKGGVAPRTTQAAMRQSSIDLTMNVYTDPRLLDLRGAVDALPELPLDAHATSDRTALPATGTDATWPAIAAAEFAPKFAPTEDNLVQTGDKRWQGSG